MADRQFLEQLSRKLADEGKLIEAGWVSLRLVAIPPHASATQLNEMRMAFMAGAQHLFSSIMGILDPGIEETEDDMRRMSLIDAELEAFAEEVQAMGGDTIAIRHHPLSRSQPRARWRRSFGLTAAGWCAVVWLLCGRWP